MGIHGNACNNVKSLHAKKRYKATRMKRQAKAQGKGKQKTVGEILDPELITIHHLKKRRTSARANITLSGKKKRKLLKRLRHVTKDKSQMEVEEELPKKETKSKTKKPKSDKSETEDIDMTVESNSVSEKLQHVPSTVAKRRRNRGRKKLSDPTEEDVEMVEDG
ncbi:uncharacterized protein C11orf98-like [Tubulanus polymorphus]|uniref:uncharacterized protein C11orf98-like n=1 Tax=Tubulanus polymorphus TaxID=672921 RepID=UPI003DA5FBFF